MFWLRTLLLDMKDFSFLFALNELWCAILLITLCWLLWLILYCSSRLYEPGLNPELSLLLTMELESIIAERALDRFCFFIKASLFFLIFFMWAVVDISTLEFGRSRELEPRLWLCLVLASLPTRYFGLPLAAVEDLSNECLNWSIDP